MRRPIFIAGNRMRHPRRIISVTVGENVHRILISVTKLATACCRWLRSADCDRDLESEDRDGAAHPCEHQDDRRLSGRLIDHAR